MGRERQKHKNRSGISKARRKPKSKKQILNNHIIAAGWDKSQTLAQNYKRLGLTVKLNKNTGGVEKKGLDLDLQDHEQPKVDSLKILGGSTKPAEKVEVQEARIVRDPETGRILQVLDGSEAKGRRRLDDQLNDLDSDSESGSNEVVDQHRPNSVASVPEASSRKTDTVRKLEQESQRPEKKYVRKLSEAERVFVEALVRKHGDDFGAMARDMEVNYMQRSAGELRRRVKKWSDAGGELNG